MLHTTTSQYCHFAGAMADMDAPFVLTGGGHFSIFFCAHQETQISFFLGAASVISRPEIIEVLIAGI